MHMDVGYFLIFVGVVLIAYGVSEIIKGFKLHE